MKLLAIDESSTSTGLALFEGDQVQWTKRLAPLADWPWRRRMRWITDHLRVVLEERALFPLPAHPDVVAIEDAVVHPKNPGVGITVGECRGYFFAHLDSMYGLELRVITVSPAKVRAAVGLSAFARRARSKDRYRLVAEQIGHISPTVSEDECDAYCIGLAAIARWRASSWARMAEEQVKGREGQAVS